MKEKKNGFWVRWLINVQNFDCNLNLYVCCDLVRRFDM